MASERPQDTRETLAAQWRAIEAGLPDGWSDARLLLRLRDAEQLRRATALLAPANPVGRGGAIRLHTARRGAGSSPDAIRRLLARLDAEGIAGALELVSTAEAGPAPGRDERTFVEAWDAAVATLPPDWSDLYVELELDSTDYLERGALLLAPANPSRFGPDAAFRFRVARRFGYGVSAEMGRRCLERLDQEGITGDVRILRALSDTRPVATQGPVWYVGGKSV